MSDALTSSERQKRAYIKRVEDGFARVPVWIPDTEENRTKLKEFAQKLCDEDLL